MAPRRQLHDAAVARDEGLHTVSTTRARGDTATGLTFGSISALYGLTHGFITRTQYTVLVTVVILSAFVPTLIAQMLFQPVLVDEGEEEALGAEDVSVIHHPHHVTQETHPAVAVGRPTADGHSPLSATPAAAYCDAVDRGGEAR